MAEYNLSEFRANTRKAFDEAERGEPVYIERYGEDFILMSKKNYGNTFPAAVESTPPDQKKSSLSQAKQNQTDDLWVEEL